MSRVAVNNVIGISLLLKDMQRIICEIYEMKEQLDLFFGKKKSDNRGLFCRVHQVYRLTIIL